MFIPLSKIDEEKRLVIGRAVQEVVDKTGEIIDYATAVPAFQKWSDDFSRMSGGLSRGNVRVMHNPKIVAGKVTDLSFNDADKAIDVVVKVVDDNEWKKVVEGVYTGFSVGGGYGRKWKDEATGATRYTPVVSELSLVDNPCIPTCRIAELHKADGSISEVELHGRVRSFAEVYRPTRSFAEVMLAKRQLSEAEVQQRRDAAKARWSNTAGVVGAAVGGGLGLGAGGAAIMARAFKGKPAGLGSALGLNAASLGATWLGHEAGKRIGEKRGQPRLPLKEDGSFHDGQAPISGWGQAGLVLGASAVGAGAMLLGRKPGPGMGRAARRAVEGLAARTAPKGRGGLPAVVSGKQPSSWSGPIANTRLGRAGARAGGAIGGAFEHVRTNLIAAPAVHAQTQVGAAMMRSGLGPTAKFSKAQREAAADEFLAAAKTHIPKIARSRVASAAANGARRGAMIGDAASGAAPFVAGAAAAGGAAYGAKKYRDRQKAKRS